MTDFMIYKDQSMMESICTQGKDCPIRKQRIEAANKERIDIDCCMEALRESALRESLLTAIALMVVCAAVILIFFFCIWGK